ncbi:MAG: cytidine deaminase [Candidatus Lokiarchaeota archaeon]|nr:cytidine deaminase [Candidatus Lokiarchaeota archaeon]
MPEKEEFTRPDWDDVFVDIAIDISRRSACFRNKVGAVIVRDGKYVVSMGYNGAPIHQPNCQEIGFCYREKNKIISGTQLEKCRAVGSHAESNAIAIAARLGQRTEGTTIYVVGHDVICDQCRALIANSGIIRVLHQKSNGIREIFEPAKDWTRHRIDEE